MKKKKKEISRDLIWQPDHQNGEDTLRCKL